MLTPSKEDYHHCGTCNTDSYDVKKHKLRLNYGGYVVICENCLLSLKKGIEKVLINEK